MGKKTEWESRRMELSTILLCKVAILGTQSTSSSAAPSSSSLSSSLAFLRCFFFACLNCDLIWSRTIFRRARSPRRCSSKGTTCCRVRSPGKPVEEVLVNGPVAVDFNSIAFFDLDPLLLPFSIPSKFSVYKALLS